MFTAIIKGRWGGAFTPLLKRPSRWAGDKECLTSNIKPQMERGKTFSILLGPIISQMRTFLQQLFTVVHGHQSQMADSCDLHKIRTSEGQIVIDIQHVWDMIIIQITYISQATQVTLRSLQQVWECLPRVIRQQVVPQDNLTLLIHHLFQSIEDATFGIGQPKILTSFGGEIYV